jgi:hypothetical protein
MCQRLFGEEPGSRYNEWVGFSFATGLFINALWRHGHASAGVAVERLEWGEKVVTGQQLYGDVRIEAARTLSSRPEEGLVRIAVTCTDSSGGMVCRFEIQVMVRRRSAYPRSATIAASAKMSSTPSSSVRTGVKDA